jgi:hypothetical protein
MIPVKVLCIVGSVSLKGNPLAYKVIDEVLDRLQPLKVISGMAPGLDSMAEERAKARGIPFQGYPPKVKRWHDGFMPRNLIMAQECTYLVRVVASNSTTYGSGWTRDRAKEMGKPTEEFVIPTVVDVTNVSH